MKEFLSFSHGTFSLFLSFLFYFIFLLRQGLYLVLAILGLAIVDQVGLEFTEVLLPLPLSPSGIKVWATMPAYIFKNISYKD